tara:strand:- start:72534 stop:73298 length:765 start_codon:yes stop_codon:yes gene_type:complete
MSESTAEEPRVEEIVEEEVPEEPFLQRAMNLVLELRGVEGYSDHKGLANFEFVVNATLETPESDDEEALKRQVAREESITKAFEKFYMIGRKSLLKGNLAFLLKNDVQINIGKNGKTFLPISEIYQFLEAEDPGSTITIDATVFFISQHVCPDEDLEVILGHCSEFKPAAKPGINFFDMVGGIISKVSDKVEKADRNMQNPDGSLNPRAIGETVQDMFVGGDLAESMQGLIQQATGDDFDINAAAGKLFSDMKK